MIGMVVRAMMVVVLTLLGERESIIFPAAAAPTPYYTK
jgi:hypothetical protein